MKKTDFILFLSCAVILFSCNNNPKNQIANNKSQIEKSDPLNYIINVENDIDNVYDSIKLSSYCSAITYIRLETNKNCLLGGNLKILFYNESIFIRDKKALYQFSKSGKFIRQIGSHGKGPGEYLSVFGFTVVPDSKELFLIAYPSMRILVYNLDNGNYKRSFSVNFRSFVSLIEFPQDSLTFHIVNIPQSRMNHYKSNLYFTDLSGNTVDSIPSFCIRKQGNLQGDLTSMYKKKDQLFYMTFLTDTLYKVAKEKLRTPYVIFNMGKFKTNSEINLDPKMLDANNNNLMIYRLEETPSNFYITFMRGYKMDQPMRGIYNKRESKLSFIENGNEGLINDLDGGHPFWPRQIVNDSLMIGYTDTYKVKDYLQNHPNPKSVSISFNKMVQQLDENDNPIIVIARIRHEK